MTMILIVQSQTSAAPVSASGTWSFSGKGAATGQNITEDSPTQLTIIAKGSSDEDGIDFAYQAFTATSDLQIRANIPSSADWTGIRENFTGCGVGITSTLTTTSTWFAQNWMPAVNSNARLKTGSKGAVLEQSGQIGAGMPRRVAITYNATNKAISAWESSVSTSAWFQIGASVSYNLEFPAYAYVFGTSHDFTSATTFILTSCSAGTAIGIAEFSATSTASAPPPSQRNVGYRFDGTKTLNSAGIYDNGFRIHNMIRDASASTTLNQSNGVGLSANSDSQLVTSGAPYLDTPNGAAGTIPSRKSGTYFLHSRLSWRKQYERMNGTTPVVPDKDKPRCWMYPFLLGDYSGGVHDSGACPVRWDKTFWWGFSIFVPANWENETGGTVGNFNQSDWSLVPWGSDTASRTLIQHSLWTPTSAQGHWGLRYTIRPTSINDGNFQAVDLGNLSADGDYGVWTDFVYKVRFNPFSSATDASQFTGGRNETFQPNRGILKVWKTTGAVDGNGDRAFTLRCNLSATPIGNVPNQYAPRVTPRIYRGGWNPEGTRDAANRPDSNIVGSSTDGYISLGFAQFYLGDEELHGTKFYDVNPSQLGSAEGP